MRFGNIDERAAGEWFAMLRDAPSISELQENYPGIDNVIHLFTAQLSMFFVLPFLEGRLSCADMAEAFRRYLYTAFAFGIIMRDNDRATSYVLDLYKAGNRQGAMLWNDTGRRNKTAFQPPKPSVGRLFFAHFFCPRYDKYTK